jgi:hypothetical protein
MKLLAVNNAVAHTGTVCTADGILSITQPKQSEFTRPPIEYSSSMSDYMGFALLQLLLCSCNFRSFQFEEYVCRYYPPGK